MFSTLTTPAHAGAPQARVTVVWEAQAWEDCPHGSFCLFQNAGGGGFVYIWHNPAPNVRHNIPGYFNDLASAYWNRSAHWVTIWTEAYCGGNLVDNPKAYTAPRNVTTYNDAASCVDTFNAPG